MSKAKATKIVVRAKMIRPISTCATSRCREEKSLHCFSLIVKMAEIAVAPGACR